MVTNEDNYIFAIFVTIPVQVLIREVRVNKWEIVCVQVLEKHASLRVSRNL